MTAEPLSARAPARYDMVLRTVNDIAASPRVAEFCVGITGKPSQRRAAYERWCRSKNSELHGFVVLDWEHAPDSIQRFEQRCLKKFTRIASMLTADTSAISQA